MTLRCIIVDDEPSGRRTLREFAAGAADLQLLAEFADPREALPFIVQQKPDLVFLDIQMNGMTGIELARALPSEARPDIVFVTAYDDYAVQAFELHAIDYLLKPFDDERFRDAVQRVRDRRGQGTGASGSLDALLDQLQSRIVARESASPPHKFLAESGSTMKLLDAADVEAVEADRNYVKLIVGRDSYHARSTLQQAEAALAAQPMLRVSRSTLVNMNFVREVSRTPRGDYILVLAGGTTLTSSEGQRDKVRDYLERLRVGTR